MNLKTLAMWLVVIGGLNWLLVGAFSFNIVDTILGMGSLLSKVVYIVVGLSAVWMLVDMLGMKK